MLKGTIPNTDIIFFLKRSQFGSLPVVAVSVAEALLLKIGQLLLGSFVSGLFYLIGHNIQQIKRMSTIN
jgi:hypothetical protein